MKFNYALEKKKFDAEWAKTEKEYIAAGMNERAIKEMREYDWSLFKKRRIYSVREQPMAASSFDDDDSDDSHSALLAKFMDVMSTTDDTQTHHSRYWWIEELDNAKLAKALKSISEENLEAITLLYVFGYSQNEVAKRMGMSDRTLRRHITAAKKIIEKYL